MHVHKSFTATAAAAVALTTTELKVNFSHQLLIDFRQHVCPSFDSCMLLSFLKLCSAQLKDTLYLIDSALDTFFENKLSKQ